MRGADSRRTSPALVRHTLASAISRRGLLQRALLTGHSEIQQIVTRDDPAALYYAPPKSLTVLVG
jgi:hypothetical protein